MFFGKRRQSERLLESQAYRSIQWHYQFYSHLPCHSICLGTIAIKNRELLLKENQILMKKRTWYKVSRNYLKIIILEIDSLCHKLHIQYLLSCGTLLGAVRHQDFIFWIMIEKSRDLWLWFMANPFLWWLYDTATWRKEGNSSDQMLLPWLRPVGSLFNIRPDCYIIIKYGYY